MENENLPIEKAKLKFFQRIKKQFLLRNITLAKYQKKNFPEYLKNDIDILYAIVKKYCRSFNNLSEEQQRILIENKPEVFLNFDFMVDKDTIIHKYPQAIAKIFDKLPNMDKERLLIEYPEYIKQLKEEEAVAYILGGISDDYFINHKEPEILPLITFLPEDIQVKLLTSDTKFVDKIRSINYEEIKRPNDFRNKLEYFSEKAVIEAVRILTERAKTETRDNVPLLKVMEIHNLPVEMQLKLVSIDKELINQMSAEAIVIHLDNNPLIFLKKLNTKNQIEVIKYKPEYFRFLSHNQKEKFLEEDGTLKDFIPDKDKINYRRKTHDTRLFTNAEKIKENIVQSDPYYIDYARITDYVRDKEALIELAKFEPSVLSTWGLDGYQSARKIGHTIELYKIKIQSPEILQALEVLKLNQHHIETLKRNSITTNIAKVLLNEKVMSKVSPEVIADFIKDPNIDKMKNIIVETYGEQANIIFKDRPNLTMDQIQNLDIFDEKVIEKFGIGAIHNMLSYRSVTPAIIGELVRHPEKMKEFEIFSEITEGYFEDTPLGFENKLVSFYNLRKLFLRAKVEDFTPERRENLLTVINDMNMTYDGNETSIIPLENLDDLDRYEENRNKIYDRAIEQLEDTYEVKELLFRKFFGMPYGETTSEQYTQKVLTIKDMLYYYNLATFVLDERTNESEMFTEEEIDMLELITIIDKIEDLDVLKELYNVFNERKEEILRPKDFTSIRNKIPQQYSQELVNSLLTVENAKRRSEEGENGISYVQTEDGHEIIKLHGADFRILMHTMGMNNSELSLPFDASSDEIWKYFENGCSTISGCVIEPEMLYSCAGNGNTNFNRVNLGFANVPSKQIIGMSHHDAHVSHMTREINPKFEYRSVKFNYPDELVRKTAAQITGQEPKDISHPYNEVALYRRNTNSKEIEKGTLGGRIMPDYLVVYGKVSDYHKKMAKKFSITGKPIPIVQIDLDAYPDRTYARGYRKENHQIERNSGKIVKRVKDIANIEER